MVGRRGGSKLSAQWSKEGQSSEQASILRPCSAPILTQSLSQIQNLGSEAIILSAVSCPC